ncbi:MAG: winged helix-turn-helix domain-containing protein [Conexivisphaerales archaeon]|nr:winged helix-turn-helix domain-containing protein [Conexivisphaerales archaeon]
MAKLTAQVLKEMLNIKVPERLAEISREQATSRAKIIRAIADRPKTIPEISQEIKMPVEKVTWNIMTLYRYGVVEPVEKTDEGYYRYRVRK